VGKHTGRVAWSNEVTPPGHFATDENGVDFSKRVRWNDDKDQWETHQIDADELEALQADLEQRLVHLKAQTKGKGASGGGK
jgi:hypothetical protein